MVSSSFSVAGFRRNSLLEASRSLSAETKPDVFIAEPVGSCTDLVATVTYPLRRIYGHEFAIAPLSVLVDAVRAMRVLGLTHGPKFSEKVLYIYRKQLEEADIIVINKSDLLDRTELGTLQDELKKQFPQAKQHVVSARKGDGLPGCGLTALCLTHWARADPTTSDRVSCTSHDDSFSGGLSCPGRP